MTQVQKRLGKDFLCDKTDCIYYIDTKENRKIVTDFFKEKDLLMKQLEAPFDSHDFTLIHAHRLHWAWLFYLEVK